MKKQKICIINKHMGVGGVETSLMALANAIKDECDLDLYFLSFNKDSYNEELKSFNIIKTNRFFNIAYDTQSIKSCIKQGIKKIGQLFIKLLGKLTFLVRPFIKKEKTQYDAVIFFNCMYKEVVPIGMKKFKAKKYISFIHNDPSILSKKQLNYIKRLGEKQQIVCVSKSCAEALETICPDLKGKVDFLYNIQNTEKILSKAQEFSVNYSNKTFNIVSVSRLGSEKAHIRSLKIMQKLHGENFNFCWHIIGDGECRGDIEQYIKDNNMQEYVKTYGNQNNPYPYIKNADLLYLGSIHEAAPMVFGEALTLKVPVFTTNTISAKELVGTFGFICENNEKSIYDELKHVLQNNKLVAEKKEKLKNYSYNNELIVQKFLNIIKG